MSEGEGRIESRDIEAAVDVKLFRSDGLWENPTEGEDDARRCAAGSKARIMAARGIVGHTKCLRLDGVFRNHPGCENIHISCLRDLSACHISDGYRMPD